MMEVQIPKEHYLHLPQAEEPIILDKGDNSSNQQSQPKYKGILVFMIGYLYFVQGVILSLGSTMPFIYPQLPSYSVLAIFALYTIPFSFKFISAPFSQKFNSPSYGKRKTWIIISQFICSVLIFIVSYFTNQQQATLLALILLVTVFFVTLQDISLDALTIKQLKSTQIAGVIQSTMQGAGTIFGGLVLLKLTSLEFAGNTLSLDKPVTTIDFLFKVIAVVILVPTVIIHFFFKQTVLESQVTFNQNKSIWETIYQYRVFCKISSKQCRMGIMFLIYCQGFNLFDAGYEYELVKAGFSKDTLNTLGNIISIPIIILTCFIGSIITKLGIKQVLVFVTIFSQLINVYLYILFPTDVITISILVFISGILSTARSLIISMMALGFPISPVTGMTVTMLYSMSNFGRNLSLHTKLTDLYTWKPIALIGIVLQFILLIWTYFYYDWMEKGQEIGMEQQPIQDKQPNKQRIQ